MKRAHYVLNTQTSAYACASRSLVLKFSKLSQAIARSSGYEWQPVNASWYAVERAGTQQYEQQTS